MKYRYAIFALTRVPGLLHPANVTIGFRFLGFCGCATTVTSTDSLVSQRGCDSCCTVQNTFSGRVWHACLPELPDLKSVAMHRELREVEMDPAASRPRFANPCAAPSAQICRTLTTNLGCRSGLEVESASGPTQPRTPECFAVQLEPGAGTAQQKFLTTCTSANNAFGLVELKNVQEATRVGIGHRAP